jgi:hypothetical protein
MTWPQCFFYCFIALLAAPLVYGLALVVLHLWDDANAISWPFTKTRHVSTETTTTSTSTSAPSAAVQNVCHNRKCPGYGKSLQHKCHDLDCKMHPKQGATA